MSDWWWRDAACAGQADTNGSPWDLPEHPAGGQLWTDDPRVQTALAVCATCPVMDVCRRDNDRARSIGIVAGGKVYGSSRATTPRRMPPPLPADKPRCGYKLCQQPTRDNYRAGKPLKYCSTVCMQKASRSAYAARTVDARREKDRLRPPRQRDRQSRTGTTRTTRRNAA